MKEQKAAKRRYFCSVWTLVGANVFALVVFIAAVLCSWVEANVFLVALTVFNLVVFWRRGKYAGKHRSTLFSGVNYRKAEAGAKAERVGLYAALVTLTASGASVLGGTVAIPVDTSLGQMGETVMLLFLGTPAVTYLASDYGTFRGIVRDESRRIQKIKKTKGRKLSRRVAADQ